MERLLGRRRSPQQSSAEVECSAEQTDDLSPRMARPPRRSQLWKQLRMLRRFGRKRWGSPATRGRLGGKRHTSERPASVQRSRQLGHREGHGDGQRPGPLRADADRAGERLPGDQKAQRPQHGATASGAEPSHKQDRGKVRTNTSDNGTEFHDYERIEQAHRVKFSFATPYPHGARRRREHKRADPSVPVQGQLHALNLGRDDATGAQSSPTTGPGGAWPSRYRAKFRSAPSAVLHFKVDFRRQRCRGAHLAATADIETNASLGRRATSIVARAGGLTLKYEP